MASNTLSDQRLEQRVPALNITIKIRRRGLGFNPWRYDLNLIDLSANGMALSSTEVQLIPLQKIDFELRSGHITTAGCAVVCYAADRSHQKRYGLLFIETDQCFDTFLTGESLSSIEVKRLGEEVAEQYMYQRVASEDLIFRVQNQRMIDAVTTMARRLGQMGLNVKNSEGRVVSPEQTLSVSRSGRLSIPILQDSLDTADSIKGNDRVIKNTDILLVSDDAGEINYCLDGGQAFKNIIDLLNYLCVSFDKIAVL